MDCPLDCEYLQEAHKHERLAPLSAEDVPSREIRVTEEFLEDHTDLVAAAARSLMHAAFATAGAVDRDVRDALDALVRTFRTLESGVYYETRPVNALASRIFDSTRSGIEEFRKLEAEKLGMSRTRDADVLGVLVFWQRFAMSHDNSRPRGRSFLGFLRGSFSEIEGTAPAVPASSLILP